MKTPPLPLWRMPRSRYDWVVNLIDEALEVYREPVRTLSGRDEWKYDSVRVLRRNAIVTPLAAPRARIRVATLLP